MIEYKQTIITTQQKVTKKNNYFKGAIILGALLSFIPYLLVFSAPIYVLGVILLLLSKVKKKNKLYWIFIPLIILLIFYFTLIMYISKKTNESFW